MDNNCEVPNCGNEAIDFTDGHYMCQECLAEYDNWAGMLSVMAEEAADPRLS